MLKNFNKNPLLVLIGNLLEFYDLGVFGFLSVIITPLYFQCDNGITSLFASAGVFAIGFFMRPIGAIVFGYIGDRFGRRVCLSRTILLMAVPTTLISLLPTYDQIGLAAPIILILCRLLQGFCTGGEYNNAAIYLLENGNADKKGLISGVMVASSILGFLLASLIASIVISFPEYSNWSWRLPFLLGALIGVVGYYLRKSQIQEPNFYSSLNQKSTSKEFYVNRKNIVVTICIGWLAGTLSLSLVGYMPSYLTSILHLSLSEASLVNNIGLVVYIFLLPFFGLLSDQWGHQRVMVWGTLSTIFLSYPFFHLLSAGFVYSGQIGLAVLAAMFLGPMHAYMLKLFPPSFRCRGISSAFSIGVGMLGGTAPFISAILLNKIGINEAPALYYIISGIFGLAALKLSEPLSIDVQERNIFLRNDLQKESPLF
jgi:MHS family proline/betaine transporter-like MFS transporter